MNKIIVLKAEEDIVRQGLLSEGSRNNHFSMKLLNAMGVKFDSIDADFVEFKITIDRGIFLKYAKKILSPVNNNNTIERKGLTGKVTILKVNDVKEWDVWVLDSEGAHKIEGDVQFQIRIEKKKRGDKIIINML